MTPAQLAAHLGDGWRVSDRGVAKGCARVWYYPTTNRYGAQFRNGIAGACHTADHATPDGALRKVLNDALRFARITLDDIEMVKPGFAAPIDKMRTEFKAFFDERRANVEWNYDNDGLLSRVLVDAVFPLDVLLHKLADAAR